MKLAPETVTDSLFFKMDYEFKTAPISRSWAAITRYSSISGG